METVKFSIITVCYNAEQVIRKTLESLASQTYHNYEYIVVDGKSNDCTLDIIKQFSFNNILIKSEEDAGIYDAMNKGIRCSNGEYIYFLNAGDTFYNNSILESIASYLEKEEPDLLYGDANYIYRDHEEIVRNIKKRELSKWNIAMQRFVCHQTVFVKREYYYKRNFQQQYRVMADQEWYEYWLSNGIIPAHIDLVICNYDLNGISSDQSKREENLKEYDTILKKWSPGWYCLLEPPRVFARFINAVVKSYL